MEMLHLVAASVTAGVAEFLSESEFWPGPLTLLFPKKVSLPLNTLLLLDHRLE